MVSDRLDFRMLRRNATETLQSKVTHDMKDEEVIPKNFISTKFKVIVTMCSALLLSLLMIGYHSSRQAGITIETNQLENINREHGRLEYWLTHMGQHDQECNLLSRSVPEQSWMSSIQPDKEPEFTHASAWLKSEMGK